MKELKTPIWGIEDIATTNSGGVARSIGFYNTDCEEIPRVYFVAITMWPQIDYLSVVFKSKETAQAVFDNAPSINWHMVFNPLIKPVKFRKMMNNGDTLYLEDEFFNNLIKEITCK